MSIKRDFYFFYLKEKKNTVKQKYGADKKSLKQKKYFCLSFGKGY